MGTEIGSEHQHTAATCDSTMAACSRPPRSPLACGPAQVDVATCVERYKLHKAQVDRLQENAGAFAAKVVAFCDRMGYAGLRAVLSLFQVGPSCCSTAQMSATCSMLS
jgi:hypothetical protein